MSALAQRGACAACGYDVALRKDGTVRKHLDNREPYRAGRPNWCAGEGSPPSPCSCGACAARAKAGAS